MSDAHPSEAEPAPPLVDDAKPLVTAADFATTDFDAPIASLNNADSWNISGAFRQAQIIANDRGEEGPARVFALLDAISGIHLKPEDRAQPWGPMASGGTWRSAIPSDFKGEQSAILAGLLDRARHPVLRARLADIVWTNDRKQSAIAAIAVDAYAETAERILDGSLASDIGDGFALLKALQPIHRGFQLAYAISKRGHLPARICDALKALYERAAAEKQFVAFARAAELGLYYELLDASIVADAAEAVAGSATYGKYPLAVKGVWDLGVRLRDKLNDADGKPIARTPAADLKGEPSELWYRQAINQAEGIRRHYVVAATIEPARLGMMQRFEISEAHFTTVVIHSAFVPPSQASIVALGFTRYLQGDFMSAAHLLLPQLEPCLRHVLKVNGHDPAKRFADGTEEDMDLGNLLERLRPELEAIFSPTIIAEVERLFHVKPGPALRHEMAHGKLSARACFHANVRYACWLIYRLCCLFVIPHWDTHIAPEIAAAG